VAFLDISDSVQFSGPLDKHSSAPC